MDNIEIENKAKEIRKDIIEQVYRASSGHPGGSLSIADIMAVLYFDELNIDEKNPKWEERDRLILSKGHCSPTLYGALAERGFFEKEDLKYYFPEFTPFEGQCKFNGCDHIHEPGCAVKEAVEEGKIHKIRYEDYTEMYRELKERKRY